MAVAIKTNERPGTRAQVRYVRLSASKAREVLDLIRGRHVAEADQILQFSERDAAQVIRKCLASAVANAEGNDEQDPETLEVVACYADEGPTLKRWRPRARGRATRIRKRTCHITVIVARMPEDALRRWNERHAGPATAARGRRRAGASPSDRRARVARSRQRDQGATDADETTTDEATETDETSDADVDEATEALEAEVVEGVDEAPAPGPAGAEAELAEQDAAAEQDPAPELDEPDSSEETDATGVDEEDDR